MPSATILRAITAHEAADALKEQLGSGYKVTPHAGGSRQKLTVSHGGGWRSPPCTWFRTGMPPRSACTAVA